jgi:hypothetical protein
MQSTIFVKYLSMLMIIMTLSLIGQNSSAEVIEPISKHEFAKKALAYKQQLEPHSSHRLTEDFSIATSNTDDTKYSTYLDNAYAIYVQDPSNLDFIFERFLANYNSEQYSQSSLDKKLANLMPVLKDDGYINNVKAMIKKQKSDIAFPLYYEPLNNGLNLMYVFDTPEKMQFLSDKNLDELGLEKAQVKERAINNLLNAVPQLSVSGDTSFISYLVADENYEASFLLVDQLWSKDNFPVKGDIIVFAMSRSLVFITGSEDKAGIEAILNIKNAPDAPTSHALASTFLVRKENKWKVFHHNQ